MKISHRFALLLLLFLSLALTSPPRPALASSARAEIEEEDAQVEILGATKHPIPVIHAPQNVTVITRKEIAELNPRDLPELFRMLPGVDVFEKSEGEFEVSVLGSNRDYNNRCMVLMDGRCMTNPIFGTTMWPELPIILDTIERIEVVKGPSSAQYGANAFAGVINIVTDHSDPTIRQGVRSSTTVGEYGYLSQSLRVADWNKNQGFTASLRYWTSGGLTPVVDRFGNPSVGFEGVENEFKKIIGVIDYERTWGSRTRLSARLSHVNNNTSSLGIFSWQYHTEATRMTDTSTLWFVELFHQIDKRNALTLKAQSNRFQTDMAESGFTRWTGDPRNHERDSFDEVEIQGRSVFDKAAFVYGATMRNSVSDGLEIQWPKKTIRTETAYAQMEYALDKKTDLFAGLLLYDSSMSGFDWSPKVSVLHKLGKNEVVRAGWGRSFRAPEGVAYFVNPFTRVPMTVLVPGMVNAVQSSALIPAPFRPLLVQALQASSGNTAYVIDAAGNPSPFAQGNTALQNEQLEQVDLGWEKRTERSRLKLDLWYSDAYDLVLAQAVAGRPIFLRCTFTPTGNPIVDGALATFFGTVPSPQPLQMFQNTDIRQISQGVTLEAGRQFTRKLRLDGNVTYQDVEVTGQHYYEADPATNRWISRPPFAPHWKATAVARYQPTRREVFTAVGNHTSDFHSGTLITPSSAYVPGFTTLDLSYWRKLTRTRETALALSVKNVFDTVHHEQIVPLDVVDRALPYGGFQHGRTCLATLTARF